MAQIERLDFTGLSYYDSKIKAWVEGQFTENEPDLSGYFNGVDYKKADKKIYFKNGESNVASVDVTDFMLDKAVDDVEIADGSGDNTGKKVLKITWNTDAGSKTVEIALEKIFDPSNYMTKTQVEDALKLKADASKVTELETEVGKKLDESKYNTDKATFETKENAAATYQPKGEYALKSEIPDDYLTDSDLVPYAKTADLTTVSTSQIDTLFS